MDRWLQWIRNCVCALEDTWASADIQLQLSVYLLTGVVVLWFLIGIAWWKYGEAISNLFELRSMNLRTMQYCIHPLLWLFTYILGNYSYHTHTF